LSDGPTHNRLDDPVLADLLEQPGTDRLGDQESRPIVMGFFALDDAFEIIPEPERWSALRDFVMLEVCPELADPDFATGVDAIGSLVTEPARREAAAPAQDSSSLSPELGQQPLEAIDEWLWALGAVVIAFVGGWMLGLRPDASQMGPVALWAPPVFFVASAVFALSQLRQNRLGVGLATMVLGLASVGISSAYVSGLSTGIEPVVVTLAGHVACLMTGAVSSVLAALVVVLRKRRISLRSAAWMGGIGSLVGAAALHLHCPISGQAHFFMGHLPGVLVGALAVAGLTYGLQRLWEPAPAPVT